MQHLNNFFMIKTLPVKVVLVVGLLLYMVQQEAQAQILNVERQRTEADTANVWLGNITFTLSQRKQQVNVLSFNWAMNVAYLSQLHNYSFISNINLIKVSGRDVISDAYMHGRINFFRHKAISGEAFGQHQYDKGRGLERRVLVGAGLRWKFTKSEKLSMTFGPGVMHEQEEWLTPGVPRSDYSTVYVSFLKSTNYLMLRWDPNATYSLNTITYYQARFDSFWQPRLTTEINLNTKINKHFLFTTRFTAQYDAIPVIPIDKFVYTFTNGVTLRF
jgi:putative salt-induced outer membrane protein YdiY